MNHENLPASLRTHLEQLHALIQGGVSDSYEETVIDATAVLRTANAMLEKMQASGRAGRSGWHDPSRCSTVLLMSALLDHIEKGDMVDVANFSMMLWMRQQTDDPAYFRAALLETLDAFASGFSDNPLKLRLSDPLTVDDLRRAGEQMSQQVTDQIYQLQSRIPKGAKLRLRPEASNHDGRIASVSLKFEVSCDG